MRDFGKQFINDLLICREATKAKKVLLITPDKSSKIHAIERIKNIMNNTWPIGLRIVEVSELRPTKPYSEISGASSYIIIDDLV